MPSPSVRVRFAPSPTGYLHLGGLRTALYNFLFAKQKNGRLIFRLEDTDQRRLVPDALEKMKKSFLSLGIEFDESPWTNGNYGPYIQSQRQEIYQSFAQKLLQSGFAYKCFCSHERLEKMRESSQKIGKPPKYDRKCLNLAPDEIRKRDTEKTPFTVRMKIPDGKTVFHDLVHGRVEFDNKTIDDQIIIKADGIPTYHLANVIDDHLMNITHVIRGEEWLTSTPKHLILYKALGLTPPQFAHLPLLLNTDKSKLSKRNHDSSLDSFLREGYLPETILNFVALLGWSPDQGNHAVMTMNDLITNFSIDKVSKTNTVVYRDLLDTLNRAHLQIQWQDDRRKEEIINEIRKQVCAVYDVKMVDETYLTREYISQVFSVLQTRISKLSDISEKSSYLFSLPSYDTEEAIEMSIKSNCNSSTVETVCIEELARLNTKEMEIGEFIETFGRDRISSKSRKLVLRYLLSASRMGPPLEDILRLLGPQETRKRLENFMKSKK